MPSAITFDHVRQARMGWTTRLAESFLEQLQLSSGVYGCRYHSRGLDF